MPSRYKILEPPVVYTRDVLSFKAHVTLENTKPIRSQFEIF